MQRIEDNRPEFWEGGQNLLVRGWTYLDRGFTLFNQAKNYLFVLFGSYWTIKTMDLWIKTGWTDKTLLILVGSIAVIGTLALLIIGRWHLYKASKTQEFVQVTKGSVIGYNNYNVNVESLEVLNKILKKLEDTR